MKIREIEIEIERDRQRKRDENIKVPEKFTLQLIYIDALRQKVDNVLVFTPRPNMTDVREVCFSQVCIFSPG